MGDRGNIVVKDGSEQVWLYSHWTGTELPEILATALARNQRWTDAPYLARIIFCEMIKGQESEETGFGISASIGDNEHDILVVDVEKQEVLIHNSDDHTLKGKPKKRIPFKKFAKNAEPSNA